MKIAILSDVHGNLAALTTVFEFLLTNQIDKIICLGDIVGYGPWPCECLELLRDNNIPCLKGNHDEAAASDDPLESFNQIAKDALLWTRKQLDDSQKAFLQNLPYQLTFNNILFSHSTPVFPERWMYLFSEAEALDQFSGYYHALAFVGHTHIPCIFGKKTGLLLPDSLSLDLDRDRYIINAGSVGQPRDGDCRACFVVYDDEQQAVSFIRLEYPLRETYHDILASDLPAQLARRLLTGS